MVLALVQLRPHSGTEPEQVTVRGKSHCPHKQLLSCLSPASGHCHPTSLLRHPCSKIPALALSHGLRSPVPSQTPSCPIHFSGTTPDLQFSLFPSLLRDHSNLGSPLAPSLPHRSFQPWHHPSPHQFSPKSVTTPQTSSPTSAMPHPTLVLEPSPSPQSTGNLGRSSSAGTPQCQPSPSRSRALPGAGIRRDQAGSGLGAARPQAHV